MALLKWLLKINGMRLSIYVAILVFTYHFLASMLVIKLPILDVFENKLLDYKFNWRGPKSISEPAVAVASVDDKSLEAYGTFPWPRNVMADMVNALKDYGAKVVVFDMVFADKKSDAKRTVYEDLAQKLIENHVDTALTRADQIQQSQQTLELKKPLQAVQDLVVSELSKESPEEMLGKAIHNHGNAVLGVFFLKHTTENFPEEIREQQMRTIEKSGIATVYKSTLVDGKFTRLQPIQHSQVVINRLYSESSYYSIINQEQAVVNLHTISDNNIHFAHFNTEPDPDGVLRKSPLLLKMRGSNHLYPGLPLKAASLFLEEDIYPIYGTIGSDKLDYIQLGEVNIPLDEYGLTMYNYYGRFSDTFKTFSIVDIINKKVDPASLKDKIVFVAATAYGTFDQRVTPFDSFVPGVATHVTMTQNIIDNNFLLRPTGIQIGEGFLFLLIGILAGFVFPKVRVESGFLLIIVFLGFFWWADLKFFFNRGIWLHSLVPIGQVIFTYIVIISYRFLIEERAKRATKKAFGHYLTPAVMERVLLHPEKYLKLGGERYEATVLFSDIRGFTTISEALAPEQLGKLLNMYMTPMTNIVFNHKGTLDKYMGDAVMAFWGAPIEQPEHPKLAAKAALEMIEKLKEINPILISQHLPQVDIGIGLSTGPMTIGNMGSDSYFAYTALGDNVNLGSRLEGQTKQYGVHIIVSENTRKILASDFVTRELDSIIVKGKHLPVKIFQLLQEGRPDEKLAKFIHDFELALQLYRKREFDHAIEIFSQTKNINGEDTDKTSILYIHRCESYKENPPPEDWDGTYTALSK